MIADTAFIHPLAHVEGARIGARTQVWQFASVIRGAVIGSDCVIGAGAMIDGVTIGEGCRISHAASLHPGVRLSDNVFVGPGAVICNDMWPETSKDGFDVNWYRSGHCAVIVSEGASIGANAVVLPGVRVGRGSVVAAGAVLSRDLPEFCVWRRNGYVSRIPSDRRLKRMREAKEMSQVSHETVVDESAVN